MFESSRMNPLMMVLDGEEILVSNNRENVKKKAMYFTAKTHRKQKANSGNKIEKRKD